MALTAAKTLLTTKQPKIIIKQPITWSKVENRFPNYETVFNEANVFDYFEIDASQINYKGSWQTAWFGFTKFKTKEHKSVELLVVIGGWGGTRSVISYRIPTNPNIPGDCGYFVVQKYHTLSELHGYRKGSTRSIIF